jgi:hypothetical protein
MDTKWCHIVFGFLVATAAASPATDSSPSAVNRIDESGSRSVNGSGVSFQNGRQLSQLDVVLDSLEKALAFMKEKADSLNLDAVIGSRIVEGLSVCHIVS